MEGGGGGVVRIKGSRGSCADKRGRGVVLTPDKRGRRIVQTADKRGGSGGDGEYRKEYTGEKGRCR